MHNNVNDLSFERIVSNDPSDKGYFIQLMDAAQTFIKAEFDGGRINGTDYATVYLGTMQFAIDKSIEYASNELLQNQQAELIYAQTEEVLKSGVRADTALASDEAMKAAQIRGIDADVNLKVKQLDALDADISLTTANVGLVGANTDNAIAEKALVDQRVLTETANSQLVTEQYESEALRNKTGGLIDKQIEREAASASLVINQAAVEAKKTVTDGLMDAQLDQIRAEITRLASQNTLVTAQVATETANLGLISNQAEKMSSEKQLVDQQITSEKWNNGTLAGSSGKGTIQAQIDLLIAKSSTEAINTDVMTKQAALYDAQAEGFKYKQNKELLKVVTDMWSVRGSNTGEFGITDISPSNLSVSGISVASLIQSAKWD